MGAGNLGRTVARMHHKISILFTDIVGFTSMSQTCQPYEVMHFLHDLFVEFDGLVDMDSQVSRNSEETQGHFVDSAIPDSAFASLQSHTHTHTLYLILLSCGR